MIALSNLACAVTRALLPMCLAVGLAACSPTPADVSVDEAVFRPPLGLGTVGVAYLDIRSNTADAIVGVDSQQAVAVEIHQTIVEGAQTTMRPVERVELLANQTVSFAPGGLHLMVIDPQPTDDAQTFPVTIRLESGRTLSVECAVTLPSAR